MVANTDMKKQLVKRWGALKNERSSWIEHWRELSEALMPRSGRFMLQDRNKGDRRHNNIIDNTGPRALRILGAGMMSGNTSPAKPWFRLATSDPDLMKYQPVKIWLSDTTALLHRIFQASNTYRALHMMYEELGAFGTAVSIVQPDYKSVIHHFPLTIGEYALATNWKGEITTLYREFQKTVHELVAEFGLANCSTTVRNLYNRGNLDSWVSIVHAIEPRSDRDPSKADGKNMAWRSIYFESSQGTEHVLRESGFKRFPALAGRWAVSGGDVYGNSPGMEALGDCRQLQHEQRRKGQAIDYQTNPPLQVPTSMKSRDVERLPGGITYIDAATPHAGIRSAFDVNLNLEHLREDIMDVRSRIDSSFYVDLFMMMANDTRSGITATEIAERHEEKLIMLGPVMERLQNEILDPLIEITFDQVMAAGIAPPPPKELQQKKLDVELVSMLAQAQRAVSTSSIDRYVGFLGSVAGLKPEILDKFDADKSADEYADSLGINPELVLPDDQVQAIREQRAKAQQQAQQAAMMQQQVDAAQKLGSVDTSKQNALTDITQAFSGYSS